MAIDPKVLAAYVEEVREQRREQRRKDLEKTAERLADAHRNALIRKLFSGAVLLTLMTLSACLAVDRPDGEETRYCCELREWARVD
jgi:hypothetical protein